MSELDQLVSLHNQDLVRFFVSIPLNRFLDAAKLLLCKADDLGVEDLRDGLRGAHMTVDMTNATTPSVAVVAPLLPRTLGQVYTV